MPTPSEPDDLVHAGGSRKKGKRGPKQEPTPRPIAAPPVLHAYTIPEVAALLSISETQVDKEIAAKHLGRIKIGASTRVTYAQLADYIRRKQIESGFLEAA